MKSGVLCVLVGFCGWFLPDWSRYLLVAVGVVSALTWEWWKRAELGRI